MVQGSENGLKIAGLHFGGVLPVCQGGPQEIHSPQHALWRGIRVPPRSADPAAERGILVERGGEELHEALCIFGEGDQVPG